MEGLGLWGKAGSSGAGRGGEGEEPEPREGSWWPRHPVGGQEAGGLRDASEVSQGLGTGRQMRGLEGAGCRSVCRGGCWSQEGERRGGHFSVVEVGSEDAGNGLRVWDPV